MANLETQLVDDIIVNSRRKMLTLGGTALAGMFLGAAAPKAEAATGYSDADILNFALNLEYLESNFYYYAAFGCPIDKPNAAAIAAGAPAKGIPVTVGVGTAGGTAVGPTAAVPFTTFTTASFAAETAIEEGRHVLFLQTALGSSTQIAQPLLNITTSFQMLAAAANANNTSGVVIPPTFTPYDNDNDFLVGAYVFEDVGVTAYHGAAPLLTVSGNLSAAGGILAVEAYHAGLLRTRINALDPTGSVGLVGYTNSISNLRSILAKAAQPQTLGTGTSVVSGIDYDPQNGATQDDYGLGQFSVSLGGVAGFSSTRIVDSDTTDTVNPLPLAVSSARTPTQVLNIVTGGGAVSGGKAVSPATGVFFPNGLNGLFK